MRLACVIVIALVPPAGGGERAAPQRRPAAPVQRWAQGGKINGFLNVLPASIGFQAGDPDQGSAAATPVEVQWRGKGDDEHRTWTLTAQATAASFNSCPTVPASAVTVTCQAVDSDAGACAAPFRLSGAPHVAATGAEAQNNRSYSVSLAFTLDDSWRFVASTNPQCTLTVTYTLDFP